MAISRLLTWSSFNSSERLFKISVFGARSLFKYSISLTATEHISSGIADIYLSYAWLISMAISGLPTWSSFNSSERFFKISVFGARSPFKYSISLAATEHISSGIADIYLSYAWLISMATSRLPAWSSFAEDGRGRGFWGGVRNQRLFSMRKIRFFERPACDYL